MTDEKPIDDERARAKEKPNRKEREPDPLRNPNKGSEP